MEGNEMALDLELGDAPNVPPALEENTTRLKEDPLGYNPQLNCGYDPELRDDRLENKKKLRRRFEHIFEKYERDFGGIGDEIDLKTGKIVVDNGHLQSMQHEQDIGAKGPSENAQSTTEIAELSGAVFNLEQSEDNGSEDGYSEYDGSDSDVEEGFFERANNDELGAVEVNLDSATSTFDADESSLEDDLTNGHIKAPVIAEPTFAPVLHGKTTITRERSESAVTTGSGTSTDNTNLSNTPNDNLFDQVPGLRESMRALQSSYKHGQSMDQDAIQALGMSIANQLATVISRPRKDISKRESKNPGDSTWSFPKLPGDDHRKRRYRSPDPQPEPREAPPSGKKSIWAPIRHPRQQKRRRMKARSQSEPVEEDDYGSSFLPDIEEPTRHLPDGTQNDDSRKCTNCESCDSDVWRKGPDGDLCNTCGMYLYRYGLMRPIESFTGDGDPQTPEDTEGEMDPLERDWWLACTSPSSTKQIEIVKPVGVKNSHFVIEEDALIIRLKEIDLLSWERMGAYFPGRSAYALQCRYSKKLRGRAPEARSLLVERGYKGEPDANGILIFTYTQEPFREEEDELLLKLRDEDELGWVAVAASLPGRAPEALESRYHELAEQLIGADFDDSDSSQRQRRASRERSYSPVRGLRYSAEEDANLVKFREVDKLTWAKIAKNMEGRNSFSLQKRYIRELCGKHPDSILPPRKAYDRSTPALDSTRLHGEHSNHGGEGSPPSTEIGSSINARYSAEEDALLLDLRDGQRLTWEQIDPRLPRRSRMSLIKRYSYIRSKHDNEWQHDPNTEGFARPAAEVIADVSIGKDGNESEPGPSITAGKPSDNLNPEVHFIATESLQAEQMFAEHEDDLIVKLREVEGLPWPDIAAQLPGKTVPSISQRYYHYLLHRKVKVVQNQAVGSTYQTSLSPSHLDDGKPTAVKRWTTEEDNVLVMLREQGKSWVEISNRLPGRTASAAKGHHAAMFDPTKKAFQSRQSLPPQKAPKGEVTLLRKAVSNLRRRSESAQSFENEGNSPVDLVGQEKSPWSEPTFEAALPNSLSLHETASGKALPRFHDNATTTNTQNHHVFQGNEHDASLYPETPITGTQMVRSSSEPTPSAGPIYATPARYNPQDHPYFVTMPAPYPLPQEVQRSKDAIPAEAEKCKKAGTWKSKASKITNFRKATERQKILTVQRPRKKVKRNRKESDYDTSDQEQLSDDDFVDEQLSANDSSESDVEDVSARSKSDDFEGIVNDSEDTGVEIEIEEQKRGRSEERDDVRSDRVEERPTNNSSRTVADCPPVSNGEEQSLPKIIRRPRGRPPIRLKPDGPPRPRGRPPKLQSEPTGGTKFVQNAVTATTGYQRTPQPRRKDFVDSSYVDAHPDEVFHHRGRGVWARGLPPSGSSNKIAVRIPGLKEKPAPKDLFDTAYVDAHPEETFYHRGIGRWAKGLPPPGFSSKVAVRGPGAKDKGDTTAAFRDAQAVQYDPAVDLKASVDGAMDKSESHGNLSLESRQLSDDKYMTENNAPRGNITDEPNKINRPSLSYRQLATLALQSKAPQALSTSEIYEYLEKTFEYFKYSKGWREGIRATLSRETQFKKESLERRSRWVLTGIPVGRRKARQSEVSTESNVPSPDATETRLATQLTTNLETSRSAETSKSNDQWTTHTEPIISSDIAREPQSETDVGNASAHSADLQLPQDSSEISVEANQGPLFSSPMLAKKRSPQIVYERTFTPETGRSTLFSSFHKLHSTDRSTPIRAESVPIPRLKSIAALQSRKRIVHTPVRDFEDSEDELAF